MGETGLRATLRSMFYRTLWRLGRRYCDNPACPTTIATGRGHYRWWHAKETP